MNKSIENSLFYVYGGVDTLEDFDAIFYDCKLYRDIGKYKFMDYIPKIVLRFSKSKMEFYNSDSKLIDSFNISLNIE